MRNFNATCRAHNVTSATSKATCGTLKSEPCTSDSTCRISKETGGIFKFRCWRQGGGQWNFPVNEARQPMEQVDRTKLIERLSSATKARRISSKAIRVCGSQNPKVFGVIFHRRSRLPR